MMTFRLSVEQFRQLLSVLLADDAPDELANLVLMACTRPKLGVISVPIQPGDGAVLRDLVHRRASADPGLLPLAELLAQQYVTTVNL